MTEPNLTITNFKKHYCQGYNCHKPLSSNFRRQSQLCHSCRCKERLGIAHAIQALKRLSNLAVQFYPLRKQTTWFDYEADLVAQTIQEVEAIWIPTSHYINLEQT